MGQQLGVNENNRRTKAYKKRKSIFSNRRSTLSHTFAISNNEQTVHLPNLNSANEDELQSVHEIDLELARNIIKHRKTIGYYQRVEDLVVVPGMGAKKFNLIKHQVCVLNRCSTFTSSQSFDSLKSVDSFTKPNKLVDINKASIFELQLLNGVTQEIAASIVHYRSKKGPFKNISELRKIKCIDVILLDNICRYLTIQEDEDHTRKSNGDLLESTQQNNVTITNGFIRPNGNNALIRNHLTNGITNGLPKNALIDIFELLSAYSPRPIVNEIFNYSRNDRAAMRVASWNLQDLSVHKASNLGVKEVICRTILENGWSILAVQGILDVDSLKIICEELNTPKLNRVDDWKSNSRQWKYEILLTGSEKLGFLYDSKKGEDQIRITSSEKGPPEWNCFCVTMLTSFIVGETAKVQILNLKVSDNVLTETMNISMKTVMNFDTNLIICSDFSVSPSFGDFLYDFELARPSPVKFSKKTNQTTSSFLLSDSLQRNLTGFNGVVRHGLSHLAIPAGWSWGGVVSFCSPIWTEFYVGND